MVKGCLPKTFLIDMAGYTAPQDIKIVNVLDTLARSLYQELQAIKNLLFELTIQPVFEFHKKPRLQ